MSKRFEMKQVGEEAWEDMVGWSLGHESTGLLDLEEIFPVWDYGHALAYLWRRFGPPQTRGDEYKELVSYLLTTPHQDVFLRAYPYFKVYHSFGIIMTRELDEQYTAEEVGCRRKEPVLTVRRPVLEAIRTALKDLERPTNVRDWYINIAGRVYDGELIDDCVAYYHEEE